MHLQDQIENRKEMLETSTIKETEDYVYYNAFVLNQSKIPKDLTYNDDRPQAIISDYLKYNWKGALVRFSLSSFLLPKAIFAPDKWIITFVKGGAPFSAPLQFVPSTQYTQTPSQLIMDLNQLLVMINNAFKTAYIAAGIASVAGAPFMTYDPSTELFTIITDTVNYLPAATSITPTQIYFNFGLNSLFGSTFPYFITNPPPFADCDVAIKIYCNGSNVNFPGTPPIIYEYNGYYPPTPAAPVAISIPTYNTVTIESPLNSIQQINRILIRDNSKMGIRTQAYGSNVVSEANNLLFNIIEDFIYPLEDRSIIIYNALPIRYFNMMGDYQFNQVAFSVEYMDTNLRTYPVQIVPGSVSEFKFQFVKQYRSTTPKILQQLLDYVSSGKKLEKSQQAK